jgi:hypothetical protein
MRRSECPLVGAVLILISTVLVPSSLEGSTVQVSEQGLRKVLYQKVCVFSFGCRPDSNTWLVDRKCIS